MRTLALLCTCMRFSLILMRRYLFDTVSLFLGIYVFFLLLFLGYRTFAGSIPGFGESVGGLIVSFMVFSYAWTALDQFAFHLTWEARQGTFEQLAMSPLGLPRVLLCRAAVQGAVNLTLIVLLLFAMMLTTGRWLHLPLEWIIPILVVTIVSVNGVGLAVAGVAMVFKRVESAFMILYFGLMALVIVPVASYPFMKLLPLALGTDLIRRVMNGGDAVTLGDFAAIALVSLVWVGFGLTVFSACERRARSLGLMGHY